MRVLRPKKMFNFTLFLFYYGLRILGAFPLPGWICLAVSVVLFFTVGGFEAVMEKPFEDTKEYKECIIGPMYNLKDRLQHEMLNLDRYRMEQKVSWKTGVLGAGIYILCCIVTVFILKLKLWIKDKIVLWFCGEIFSIAGEFWALTWIWDGYINSGAVHAKEISKKFMIRSTSIKIEETTKKINALSRRQQKDEEEDTGYFQ